VDNGGVLQRRAGGPAGGSGGERERCVGGFVLLLVVPACEFEFVAYAIGASLSLPPSLPLVPSESVDA